MTNYEKIKNMSVKEMTNYLFEHKLNFDPCIRSCVSCYYFHQCRQGDSSDWINNEIKKRIQNWLESEVEE